MWGSVGERCGKSVLRCGVGGGVGGWGSVGGDVKKSVGVWGR